MILAAKHGSAALCALLLAAGLGSAAAQSGSDEPIMLPESKGSTAAHRGGQPADTYVAEVIDSTFFVGPAEFFALDLPTVSSGAVAIHIFGTVRATGGSRDIIVRMFRGADYDRWLKRRGGDKSGPFFVSPKRKSITLDHDLPVGEKIVLLLDNGYSIRTPKRVHCQLQIQYQRGEGSTTSTVRAPKGNDAPKAPEYDDVVPVPRSNEEEDIPPPPPPPPPDDAGN